MTPDEAKLLEAACRMYPVTVDELRRELGLRPAAFELALRSLVRKGLLELEPLVDRTFVRPRSMVGDAPPPSELPPDDDPAYW